MEIIQDMEKIIWDRIDKIEQKHILKSIQNYITEHITQLKVKYIQKMK